MSYSFIIFFFNDTATTEIYTLSLHDALPIFSRRRSCGEVRIRFLRKHRPVKNRRWRHLTEILVDQARISTSDRKSTRLNSSHANISYAVFCLKKKKT